MTIIRDKKYSPKVLTVSKTVTYRVNSSVNEQASQTITTEVQTNGLHYQGKVISSITAQYLTHTEPTYKGITKHTRTLTHMSTHIHPCTHTYIRHPHTQTHTTWNLNDKAGAL